MDMKWVKIWEHFKQDIEIDIRTLVNSYLEAALWTEEDRLKEEEIDNLDYLYGEEDEDEEDDYDSIRSMIPKVDFSIDNISNDSKIKAYNDIKLFLDMVGDAIEGLDEDQLGHDIWLTRNHHGAGFSDRGYEPEIEKKLIDAAHELGTDYLYLGDDNLFHFNKE